MERNETTTNVLVFKTNLKYKKDVQLISAHLSNNDNIKKWSVAMDDADKVLRVETGNNISTSNLAAYISDKLKTSGFLCEELP